MNKILVFALTFVLFASCKQAPQQNISKVMRVAPAQSYNQEYYCNPPADYDKCPTTLPVCDPDLTIGVDQDCMNACCQSYQDSVHGEFTLMCGAASEAYNTFLSDKAGCHGDFWCIKRVTDSYNNVMSAYTTYHNGQMTQFANDYNTCIQSGGPFGIGCCILMPPTPPPHKQ